MISLGAFSFFGYAPIGVLLCLSGPDPSFVKEARTEWADFQVKDMRNELMKLTRRFDKQGGRGVDLADQIDALRVAIALRSCGK